MKIEKYYLRYSAAHFTYKTCADVDFFKIELVQLINNIHSPSAHNIHIKTRKENVPTLFGLISFHKMKLWKMNAWPCVDHPKKSHNFPEKRFLYLWFMEKIYMDLLTS